MQRRCSKREKMRKRWQSKHHGNATLQLQTNRKANTRTEARSRAESSDFNVKFSVAARRFFPDLTLSRLQFLYCVSFLTVMGNKQTKAWPQSAQSEPSAQRYDRASMFRLLYDILESFPPELVTIVQEFDSCSLVGMLCLCSSSF